MSTDSPIEASRSGHAAWYIFLRLVALLLACSAVIGLAASQLTSAITSISQSYTTTAPIPLGSIVSLERNTSDQVIASTTHNVDTLLGVVINASTALLSLSNGTDNQVQVATSGTAQVLVSDVNGPINEGDHITASPITGIGMKATDNVRIVGIAQGTMTGGSKQTYKDKTGTEQSATIGQIPVLVNVAYYFKEPEKTVIPSALQNLANAMAGKKVSSLPIIISAGIFIILIIVVSSIVYSMIRSSIISVGRNPMSQSAIYRDLIQLSALVIGILAVGLIAIYLVLTRL